MFGGLAILSMVGALHADPVTLDNTSDDGSSGIQVNIVDGTLPVLSGSQFITNNVTSLPLYSFDNRQRRERFHGGGQRHDQQRFQLQLQSVPSAL
jgi:hypothetical protein